MTTQPQPQPKTSDYGGGGVTKCERCQACAEYQVRYHYGAKRINEKLCHPHFGGINVEWIIEYRLLQPPVMVEVG